MSTPINQNYTPQQVAELTRIWENLPDADETTREADIKQLQAIQQSFPEGSSHSIMLGQIINGINSGSGFDIMDSDGVIASEIYSQLPNAVPPTMANSIQSIIQVLQNNPSNDQIIDIKNQLQTLTMEAQTIQPATPQSMVLVNYLNGATQAAGEDNSSAISQLQFVLGNQK